MASIFPETPLLTEPVSLPVGLSSTMDGGLALHIPGDLLDDGILSEALSEQLDFLKTTLLLLQERKRQQGGLFLLERLRGILVPGTDGLWLDVEVEYSGYNARSGDHQPQAMSLRLHPGTLPGEQAKMVQERLGALTAGVDRDGLYVLGMVMAKASRGTAPHPSGLRSGIRYPEVWLTAETIDTLFPHVFDDLWGEGMFDRARIRQEQAQFEKELAPALPPGRSPRL